MAKVRRKFVCNVCGATYSAWQGKCGSCESWNSIIEDLSVVTTRGGATAMGKVKSHSIKSFESHDLKRLASGFGEFDNVLGGGIVRGSLILLGGDPGIGKSTIALQILINLANNKHHVLYVSGEESGNQVRGRTERIDAKADFQVYSDNSLESVLTLLETERPEFAVIDSIQTMYSQAIQGVGGGVAQIAYATNQFMQIAKKLHIALLIIGHVTKEGNLAGPKTLEHMVDTVLYLEGEKNGSLKILKSAKNRFGSTGEVGVFELSEEGMTEVTDPSARFLGTRQFDASGVCRFPSLEGSRVMMMEIEALTNTIAYGYPRRITQGFDQGRLSTICAIIQKRLGIKLDTQDVYLNVAGGFTLDEREADLPAALAIISSFYDIVLPRPFAASGEISLSGEVRRSKLAEKRAKECEKLGFDTLLGGFERINSTKKLKIINTKSINEALKQIKSLK